jgi:DNA helicase HerA-like ATPase
VTGSGKTFTAKGLAERLLDQGKRITIGHDRFAEHKALAVTNADAYRNGFDAGVEAYGMNFEAIRATLASEAFQLIRPSNSTSPSQRRHRPRSKVLWFIAPFPPHLPR